MLAEVSRAITDSFKAISEQPMNLSPRIESRGRQIGLDLGHVARGADQRLPIRAKMGDGVAELPASASRQLGRKSRNIPRSIKLSAADSQQFGVYSACLAASALEAM